MFKCDFHLHTDRSFDGMIDAKTLARIALKKGYDIIAITDHDTMAGALEAKEFCRGKGLEVIIGIEVRSEVGDIIGLDIDSKLESSSALDIIEEIGDLGGTSILPHPCRNGTWPLNVARNVDMIEAYNSRSDPGSNARALRLAQELGKPIIGGSDSHLWMEIGNVTCHCESRLGPISSIDINYSKKTYMAISQTMGAFRQKKFDKIPYHLKNWILG